MYKGLCAPFTQARSWPSTWKEGDKPQRAGSTPDGALRGAGEADSGLQC